MILKGSQRGGAQQLARHLMNAEENEHVEVYELRGFATEGSLRSALQEVVAISKGTRCQQMLFSLSVNPPAEKSVPISSFEAAIDQAEERLGLSDQPRAIVFHEKEGRRHAHVVWSRIDVEEMKAINLPHFKIKLTDLSKQLYLEHGWDLPDGLLYKSAKDPLSFTREEWQQARRAKQDPKALKAMFQECWRSSDGRVAFEKALEERGFYLANGKRGFVALDYKGEVYAVSRWTVQKTKDLKAKLGDPGSLSSVDQTKAMIAERMTVLIKRYIRDAEEALKAKEDNIRQQKARIKERHVTAREKLNEQHARRWVEETKVRSARFRRGVAALWDWITGKSRKTAKENEQEALQAMKRDDKEREDQRQEQLEERRALQDQLNEAREKHRNEVTALRSDVASYLDVRGEDAALNSDRPVASVDKERSVKDRERDEGFEL